MFSFVSAITSFVFLDSIFLVLSTSFSLSTTDVFNTTGVKSITFIFLELLLLFNFSLFSVISIATSLSWLTFVSLRSDNLLELLLLFGLAVSFVSAKAFSLTSVMMFSFVSAITSFVFLDSIFLVLSTSFSLSTTDVFNTTEVFLELLLLFNFSLFPLSQSQPHYFG